jgi:hypothetical protein
MEHSFFQDISRFWYQNRKNFTERVYSDEQKSDVGCLKDIFLRIAPISQSFMNNQHIVRNVIICNEI